jgi:hypothetical protein
MDNLPKYSEQQIRDLIRRDLYEKRHYKSEWCEECQGYVPVINGKCGNISVHSEEYKKQSIKDREMMKYPQGLDKYGGFIYG